MTIKPWKSREGVDPPPQFFADAIAYLRRAYPGASLGREVILQLRPHLVGQWRIGQSGPKAAAATCSCDGTRITPSPASQVDLPRLVARPPKGASRSDIFGVDDLREVGRLPKLRMQAAVAARQVEHYQAARAELAMKLMAATENGREGRAFARRLMQAEQELSNHMVRLAELRTQIGELAPAALHPAAFLPASERATAKKSASPQPRARRAKEEKARPAPKPRTAATPKRGKPPRCTTCVEPASAPEPLPTEDQEELARLVNEFAQGEADELERGEA